MSSVLYIVSTPIGNLGDITLRALEVLRNVDLIACEDTRTTKKLLTRYGINKPLTSYHEHNEVGKASELVSLLLQGKSVALVSDAGTPTVSDPGFRVVKLASESAINIVPIPGPSAVLSALSVSGLPTSSFSFFGFPPRSKKQLVQLLERIEDYPETLIFYESPKRIVKTLEAMSGVLGNRAVSISREITKMHEETLRGRMSEVAAQLKDRKDIKGEVTLVIEGNSSVGEEFSTEDVDCLLIELKKEGFTLKGAVEEVSSKIGYSKSKIYKQALNIWHGK
jgi:16S rRNA (cytidine1402-2'-O)-methyltransferase